MANSVLISLFQNIEDELNRAYERNDIKKITELLSDNWTILESSTGLTDKSKFIGAIEDGKLVQIKMLKEVQEVRFFENFAIVISKGINEGQYLDKSYSSEQWVTNIYVKENVNWICIMTLEVPVNCS